MADEILDEVPTEGTVEGITTEDTTTGNGYLTKPYLVRNLQAFWSKIKTYITDKLENFADKGYVTGVVDSAVKDTATKTDLESLKNIVDSKAESSALEALEQNLGNKVDNDTFEEYKTKLDNLKPVTTSEDGLMIASDKAKLDSIDVNTIVTEVDNELKDDSENPVQNKVITAALSGKADAGTLDPLEVFKSYDLMPVESSTGDIIFTSRNTIKHVKLHTEQGEVIEKFYISGTDNSNNPEIFNTFNSDFEIRIPNPDGINLTPGAPYKFYVECLEFSDSGKYKPFILKVTRDSRNPILLHLGVFKS